MKFDINQNNKYISGSDTDSLFISLEPILKKIMEGYETSTDEQIIIEVKKMQKHLGDKLNEYQNTITKNCFNISKHYFDLKPEYIIKSTYWAGKRRYAQHIVDQEGAEKNEIIMMGLDIMKSNFPPMFKIFGEELIKSILFSKPKEEIDKFVMDFSKSIYTVEWKNLLKPTGLKKIDEYIERKALPSELFSKLKLKCPINTKAAIITNDIIRNRKLSPKYPEFTIGDKILIAYLKSNPYKIDVVGLNGYNDPPFILDLVDKYIDREGLFNGIMLNKLENLYNDLGWRLKLNQYKDLFFNF